MEPASSFNVSNHNFQSSSFRCCMAAFMKPISCLSLGTLVSTPRPSSFMPPSFVGCIGIALFRLSEITKSWIFIHIITVAAFVCRVTLPFYATGFVRKAKGKVLRLFDTTILLLVGSFGIQTSFVDSPRLHCASMSPCTVAYLYQSKLLFYFCDSKITSIHVRYTLICICMPIFSGYEAPLHSHSVVPWNSSPIHAHPIRAPDTLLFNRFHQYKPYHGCIIPTHWPVQVKFRTDLPNFVQLALLLSKSMTKGALLPEISRDMTIRDRQAWFSGQ